MSLTKNLSALRKYALLSSISRRLLARRFSDSCPKKGLVLGVYRSEGEDPKLTPTAERFNERVGGRLCEMIREVGDTYKGKGKGNVFNNLDPEFFSVCVVEIGKEGAGYDLLENIDEGRENVRVAAATGVTRLRKEDLGHIAVEDMGYAQEAAEGASLAAWQYQEYKNKCYRKIVPTLELFESCDTDGWTRGLYLADAQNLARRLSEAPSNAMTPTSFAQAAADVLCPCGINVDVRDRCWLEKNHMDLFLHIARGSCESPVLLEINYCGGDSEDKPILLVGKGTTFDAGGLYLKRDDPALDEHRADMAGAAMVIAIIRAASLLSLPINLCSVLCLCENMPSGMACKPGNILQNP
ncbi:cytosol aminopeptidase-like [Ctenocephalides felis]|uniref:cytosol aminopeptidase-like n=1 Tax=Ctenocephalides felis TaxID=7515 RepID=UPI000E6E2868|nr:cytosol aminopeptidase-like [Ctenocephalides felis]